jgi:hypothetical protein
MKQASIMLVLALVACGGGDSDTATPDANDPLDVRFGDTALVIVVNPIVNDANDQAVATPGLARAGVTLTADDGVSATTDASGIAVLAPLTAGSRTVTVTGTDVGGTFNVLMAAGELRELAIASQGATSSIMLELDYKSDRVTEINPTMSTTEVNTALEVSDQVVFFASGTYTGDLDFSGSRVTLFGEGVRGGKVIIDGSIMMSGSDSRIRGTTITGNLTVPASGTGLTFSRVNGTTDATGSDATFLRNALCGPASITGSGSFVLDNAGTPPTATCP